MLAEYVATIPDGLRGLGVLATFCALLPSERPFVYAEEVLTHGHPEIKYCLALAGLIRKTMMEIFCGQV